MKISKVNHVKVGVSEQPVKNGGMLYSISSKENHDELTNHVKKMVEKAKPLYSIFIKPKEAGKNKECCLSFNRFLKNAIISKIINGENEEKIYNSLLLEIPKCQEVKVKKKNETVMDKIQSEDITKLVNQCLKKSLRIKIKLNGKSLYIPDVLVELLNAVISGDDYKTMLNSIPKEKIIALLNVIIKDLTKEEYVDQIVNSIENQNVAVQVTEDGEKLILSSAYNPKKAYIFDFIKEYAGADENKQCEMMIRMRYLILLFCYGADIAEDAKYDLKPFSFGIVLNEHEEQYFSNELFDIIETLNNIPLNEKGEIRKNEDELRFAINNEIVAHFQLAQKTDGLSDSDKSWLRYISDHICKKLNSINGDIYKLKNTYLCENTWKEWTSFIALKFVELGKATYHFAMTNIYDVQKNQPIKIGVVDEKYRNGISSFDYERIKAEDSFARSLAGFVTFAINNFDASVRSIEERRKKNE